MLSRSLRFACSKKLVKEAVVSVSNAGLRGVRFNSTVGASSVTTTPIEKSNTRAKPLYNKDEKKSNSTPPRLVLNLYDVLDQNFAEFSPYFEKVQHIFQKASASDKRRSFYPMISLGNKLLFKIDEIKNVSKNDVPSSILYKEIITLLIENELIHVSHFDKYMKSLIIEKKFLNALTLWIENANYFKTKPKAFASKSSFSEKNVYLSYGLISYLLSLVENKESKVDPEFIKLIYGDDKPLSYLSFQNYLNDLSLTNEEIELINKFYYNYTNESFDINSAESLKGIRVASVNGKIVYLEKTIEENLKLYKGKENLIKPSTLAYYMKYLNNSKLYSKSIELWKFANQFQIELTVDIWNQLLNSFAKLTIENSRNKVESVWNLLNNSAKPNSESYSIYINYLIKDKDVSKVQEIVENLKKNEPKLFDSNLKCAMIECLLISNKITESLQLFKIYEKEKTFKPTIELFNKLLSKLIYEKNIKEAETLLDNIVLNKYENIQPDIATWTTIIDLLLKKSSKSNLSSDEILQNLLKIIETMESHKIKFNNVALTMVANNLMKNKQTHELGFSILQQLEQSGVKLNAVSYSGIITSFTDMGDTENALIYYNKALNSGILPTAFLYNSILKGFSKNPNIDETKKFLDNIKLLIKRNPQNFKLLPNKYTFYYLLVQGVTAGDVEFVNSILKELGESDTDLGIQLPTMLASLKENGYKVPESLEQKI